MHKSTKMLVEAGIIPKNVLQQLANWRLIPEGYAESHGVRPIVLRPSDPRTAHCNIDLFVQDLNEAITKDMAEIRETELDRCGSFRTARVWFANADPAGYLREVFVDRLGRVITSATEGLYERILLSGDEAPRGVAKRELRYEGDKGVAVVYYLEAKEEGTHVCA